MLWNVVLEKTLESPLDCKEIKPVNPKGNQSWIFIGRTDAEAPVLCHLMWRTDSLEKTLMLGKIEGRRRRGRQRMRWLDGITDSMDMSLSKLSWWWTGKPGVLQSMGSQRVGHDWATEQNWLKRAAKSVFFGRVFQRIWGPQVGLNLGRSFEFEKIGKACVTAAEDVGVRWGGAGVGEDFVDEGKELGFYYRLSGNICGFFFFFFKGEHYMIGILMKNWYGSWGENRL